MYMHFYIAPVCLPSNNMKMPVYSQNLVRSIFFFELYLKLEWSISEILIFKEFFFFSFLKLIKVSLW